MIAMRAAFCLTAMLALGIAPAHAENAATAAKPGVVVGEPQAPRTALPGERPPPAVPGPGLDAALSMAPPYTCVTNTYVDGANGSDSNPGTEAAPWQTITNSESGQNVPTPGECVNVLPGNYALSKTMVFGHGGNSNTRTGYVVYRSTVPQAAHIIAGGNIGDLIQLRAGYLIFDGFEIDGNKSVTSGHGFNGCVNGGKPGNIAHHWIAINNLIHDMGGAGLSSCTADFINWSHNVVYNTSATNPYETSGIDLWEPKALAAGSYAPTAADTSATFGIVISDNIARDNAERNNGHATHTDGNGIIIDMTLGSAGCPTCGTAYPGTILVSGNLVYNNGGGGVHVFLSKNVTVANNTAYNNYLDRLNPGTTRGELSNGGSANINCIGNIGFAVPGTGPLAHNAPMVTFPVNSFVDSGTWTNNVLFGAPVYGDAGNVVAAPANRIGVNPEFVAPGSNFALRPGSPAIGASATASHPPAALVAVGACPIGLKACP
jgi:parallel beta-helix repeat protein